MVFKVNDRLPEDCALRRGTLIAGVPKRSNSDPMQPAIDQIERAHAAKFAQVTGKQSASTTPEPNETIERCDEAGDAALPFAFGGASQLRLNHSDKGSARVVERLGQFEDRAKRRLLLAEFEDTDISAAQLCLKTKRFLRQASLLAQLTENSSKGNRWLQVSLLLLEELGRKRTIVSSYSYRKCMAARTTKHLLEESWAFFKN